MLDYLKKAIGWFRRRKFVVKSLIILLFTLFVVLFFGNTITKYVINNYGEDLSGRKLHVNSVDFNYLNSSVSLGDFTMYEVNKKDTFAYLGSAYVNIQPWGFLSGEISLSQIDIDRLQLIIKSKNGVFNFNDFLSDEPTDANAEPAKFYLNNIKLTNSKFTYADEANIYAVRELNISVPKLAWNSTKNDINLNFLMDEKGKIELAAFLNSTENKYHAECKVSNINVNYGEAYIQDLFNMQSIKGFIHSNIVVDGDLEDILAISVNGTTSITDFEIVDKKGMPLTSADEISVTVDSMYIKNNYFVFAETNLINMVTYAELGTDATNFDYFLEPLFVVDPTEVVDTVQKVSEEVPFHFEIKKVNMMGGKIFYTDNTLDRSFSYVLKDINLTANNISEDSKNLTSNFSMTSGDKGKIIGDMVLDMTNTYNVKYNSSFKNVDMLSFSPYSEYFIASPITQGLFNYDISLDMTETSLVNNNSFDIRELEFGKKLKSDSAYKVPVKLALMLMKDKNDNIQFDVPITGNPSEPDFKIMPLVWKTLGKFFAKAATSPMRAMSSLAGKNAEDLEFLPFEYGQSSFSADQKELLNKFIEFHEQKPALLFTFIQMTNMDEEKDVIAIIEAKKKYDTANWQTISDKDAGFHTFLVAQSGLEESSSIEKMARKVIGESVLTTKLSGLIASRNTALKNHFSTVENATKVFKIETADLVNLPAELKKGQYKIEVGVE